MALNYSHRQVTPAYISEDNLASPVRIVNGYLVEGVPEKNGSVPWHASHVEADERTFGFGRDRADCCSSSEQTSKDIVDLLPYDPFGMDIKSTFTAITGWLEGLEVDSGTGRYTRSSNGVASKEGYGLFAGWNVIWDDSFNFQPFPYTIRLNENLNTGIQSFQSYLEVNEKPNECSDYFPNSFLFDQKLNGAHTLSTYGDESGMGTGLAPYEYGFQPACSLGDVGFSNGSGICSLDMSSTGELEGSSEFERAPHEAFTYILSYLGVKDLLSVERVCSSLSSAVRADPLIWKTIHIDQPLNERITDDVLVQLVSRAQGKLECLSLVECPKITHDGLRRILETNPRLIKLCVPGCTRFSVECIISYIRAYNSNNEFGGIRHVRIGGLYGMNHEHFEELNSLLGSSEKTVERHHKPHFYRRGNFYLPYDDDRAIDIEMCPRCEKFRLVYDCPSERCNAKDKSPQFCRACTLCIGRCANCGRCINDTEFEETFYLEFQCSGCFMELEKYEEKLDKMVDSHRAQHGLSYSFSGHV